MGQAKLRKNAAGAAASLPRREIARAVREAVVGMSRQAGVADGLCGLHAAVGQRVLHERFGVEATIVAGDLQRAINERVVHSYAQAGKRLDAAVGACHVWLVQKTSRALIDFDAWEEPKRYEALGSPQGPWTAPRPDFYWTAPGQDHHGIVRVVPDRSVTEQVLARLTSGTTAAFVVTAALKAMQALELLGV